VASPAIQSGAGHPLGSPQPSGWLRSWAPPAPPAGLRRPPP